MLNFPSLFTLVPGPNKGYRDHISLYICSYSVGHLRLLVEVRCGKGASQPFFDGVV